MDAYGFVCSRAERKRVNAHLFVYRQALLKFEGASLAICTILMSRASSFKLACDRAYANHRNRVTIAVAMAHFPRDLAAIVTDYAIRDQLSFFNRIHVCIGSFRKFIINIGADFDSNVCVGITATNCPAWIETRWRKLGLFSIVCELDDAGWSRELAIVDTYLDNHYSDYYSVYNNIRDQLMIAISGYTIDWI
jgi:hypothetical protein